MYIYMCVFVINTFHLIFIFVIFQYLFIWSYIDNISCIFTLLIFFTNAFFCNI